MNKTFIIKNYASIGIIILVLVSIFSGIFFYVGKSSNKTEEPEISMLESEFVEYKHFMEDLFKTYPYYEPDGVTYKETIYKLLENKKTEADTLYKDIIKSIPDLVKEEYSDGSGTFMQAPTNLPVKTDLIKLHASFAKNAELTCSLRTDAWQGGSGSAVGVKICEIYEFEKYIELLKDIRE